MREAGTVFLVMQYIEGADLFDCIVNRMAETKTIKLMTQICKVVQAVNAKKVLHLDLKPENILVRRSDGQPFLADFGLSQRFGSISQGGSSAYAAPEICVRVGCMKSRHRILRDDLRSLTSTRNGQGPTRTIHARVWFQIHSASYSIHATLFSRGSDYTRSSHQIDKQDHDQIKKISNLTTRS